MVAMEPKLHSRAPRGAWEGIPPELPPELPPEPHRGAGGWEGCEDRGNSKRGSVETGAAWRWRKVARRCWGEMPAGGGGRGGLCGKGRGLAGREGGCRSRTRAWARCPPWGASRRWPFDLTTNGLFSISEAGPAPGSQAGRVARHRGLFAHSGPGDSLSDSSCTPRERPGGGPLAKDSRRPGLGGWGVRAPRPVFAGPGAAGRGVWAGPGSVWGQLCCARGSKRDRPSARMETFLGVKAAHREEARPPREACNAEKAAVPSPPSTHHAANQ